MRVVSFCKRGVPVGGFLWGLVVALAAWVLVKLVVGVAGAFLHLLLVVAVPMAPYMLLGLAIWLRGAGSGTAPVGGGARRER